MARLFNFAQHPEWLRITSKPLRHQTGLEKAANAIMYGADSSSLYLDLTGPRSKKRKNKMQHPTRHLEGLPKLGLPYFALALPKQHIMRTRIELAMLPGATERLCLQQPMFDHAQALAACLIRASIVRVLVHFVTDDLA